MSLKWVSEWASRLPGPSVDKSTGAFWYFGYYARERGVVESGSESGSSRTRAYTSQEDIMVVNGDLVEDASLTAESPSIK